MQHLPDLAGVDLGRPEVLGQREPRLARRAAQRYGCRFRDERAEPRDRPQRRAGAREGEQLLGQIARTERRGLGRLQRLCDVGQVRGALPRHAHEAEDGAQQVVEVVTEAAGHDAERLEPLDTAKLALQRLLGGNAIGDVGRHADQSLDLAIACRARGDPRLEHRVADHGGHGHRGPGQELGHQLLEAAERGKHVEHPLADDLRGIDADRVERRATREREAALAIHDPQRDRRVGHHEAQQTQLSLALAELRFELGQSCDQRLGIQVGRLGHGRLAPLWMPGSGALPSERGHVVHVSPLHRSGTPRNRTLTIWRRSRAVQARRGARANHWPRAVSVRDGGG